ncbi:hypothetical protein HRbin06_00187 [archaeon HR06]|nr:hypothetical protein HRbin06_00187 [archaeon HR06]
MPKYYSELLAKINTPSKLFIFDALVLKRYSEIDGPWKLYKDKLVLFTWLDDQPEKLLTLNFTSSKGKVMVKLIELASLPKSEQEHWKKFEISS